MSVSQRLNSITKVCVIDQLSYLLGDSISMICSLLAVLVALHAVENRALEAEGRYV